MAGQPAQIAVKYDPMRSCLCPASKASEQIMATLKPDVVYMIERPKLRRKGKLHRLFWALCQYVANAVNAGPTALSEVDCEDVSDRIKIATGKAQIVKLPKAQAEAYGTSIAVKPVSIAFSKMGDEEFSRLVTAGMIFVRDELCPYLMDGPDKSEIVAILEASHVPPDLMGHNGGPDMEDAA